MRPNFLVRVLASLAIVPAWTASTPAYAQQRRGGGGGSNIAGQFLQSLGNSMQQPGYRPPAGTQPPLGGSNVGRHTLIGNTSVGGMQGPRPPATGASPYIGPSNLGGFNNPGNFNSSGLANAFGGQPAYRPSPYQGYQQPPYQPSPYQGYQPSQYQPPQQASAGPNPGQAYQIPALYANQAAGSVITWGSYRYLIGSDGTMTLYNGPATAMAAAASGVPTQSQAAGSPTPGGRYQIPAQHAGATPGSQVTYAGYTYVVNNDGTMTAFNVPGQNDANVEQVATGPVPGKRYQIPAEHAGSAPGSLISYGGNSYVANNDGTMTAFTSPK